MTHVAFEARPGRQWFYALMWVHMHMPASLSISTKLLACVIMKLSSECSVLHNGRRESSGLSVDFMVNKSTAMHTIHSRTTHTRQLTHTIGLLRLFNLYMASTRVVSKSCMITSCAQHFRVNNHQPIESLD